MQLTSVHKARPHTPLITKGNLNYYPELPAACEVEAATSDCLFVFLVFLNLSIGLFVYLGLFIRVFAFVCVCEDARILIMDG